MANPLAEYYHKTFYPDLDISEVENAFFSNPDIQNVAMEHLHKTHYSDIPKPSFLEKIKRKPIYVNDPNDPRLRAYNDSSDLHNISEYQKSLVGVKIRFPMTSLPLPIPESSMVFDENASIVQKRLRPNGYNPWLATLGVGEKPILADEEFSYERKTKEEVRKGIKGQIPKSKNDQLVLDKIKQLNNSNIYGIGRNSPEFYHPTIHPIAFYEQDGIENPVNFEYKKPVQPIVYQPKPKVVAKHPTKPTTKPIYQPVKLTNFEQRIQNPTLKIDNRDGTTSTHKMMSFESDGKYYAAPTIVEQNGKLVELTTDEAFKYAMKNKEYKEFKTNKEAKDYANNGYKKGTPLEVMIPINQREISAKQPKTTMGTFYQGRDFMEKYKLKPDYYTEEFLLKRLLDNYKRFGDNKKYQ